MSQLEYLIALISIIVGLGLTELARSRRELVRPSRRVRWHWLPLACGAPCRTSRRGFVQLFLTQCQHSLYILEALSTPNNLVRDLE